MSKKVFKIIAAIVLVVAFIVGIVLYRVYPEQTKGAWDTIVEYMNKPLPIIGISLVVAGGILFKFFSMTAYGKRAIAKLKEEFNSEKEEIKKEYDSQIEDYKKIINSQDEKIDFMYETLDKVCDAIPNKKVHELKKELFEKYGERTNNQKAKK